MNVSLIHAYTDIYPLDNIADFILEVSKLSSKYIKTSVLLSNLFPE